MATSWTSGWSSDGQRPRPHCPGMRSPPTPQAHKLNNGGSDRQTALVRPIGITVRRPTVRPHPSIGCALRPSEPTRNGRTLSVCAGHRLGWSPPPESNRRPHPYHGTTGNRCAEPRFPSSRPTVGVEVIGSLPAKVCAHFRPRAGRHRSGTGGSAVHNLLDATAGQLEHRCHRQVAPAITRLKSGRGVGQVVGLPCRGHHPVGP
jgi:hypothetical protein